MMQLHDTHTTRKQLFGQGKVHREKYNNNSGVRRHEEMKERWEKICIDASYVRDDDESEKMGKHFRMECNAARCIGKARRFPTSPQRV
jgi:hypothetical protein